MGRSGSQIIPFLLRGLASKKYINLKYVDEAQSVFSLLLPRKTQKLEAKYEQILKDWRAFRKQPYKYTKAKQAVESALKKSVFLKQLPSQGEIWLYRKLDNSEIKAKKQQLKELAAMKKEIRNPDSVGSSGYGSGGDSPASTSSEVVEEVASLAIKKEHAYSLLTDALNEDSVWSIQEVTIGESEENSDMEHDSDCLQESSFVDPNSIIIDHRNTQSSNFHTEVTDVEAMEIDGTERMDKIENESSDTFKIDPFVLNAYSSYLGAYDLQEAFADFPVETACDSEKWNQLVENIYPSVGPSGFSCLINPGLLPINPFCASSDKKLFEGSLPIPSVDGNLGTMKKSTKVYCFKESKSVDGGEVWIFEPQVQEITTNGSNEKDPSSSKMILDNKELKTLLTSKRIESIEVNSMVDHISVFLKHTENL